MRLFLDGTNFKGSEADTSLPKNGGDVFGTDAQDENGQVVDAPAVSGEAISSDGRPDSASGQSIQNAPQNDKLRLIEEAKKIMRRGAGRAPERLAARVGAPKEITKAFTSDTPENREQVKDFAKGKAREFAKDKIGDQLKGGVKKGFEKGIEEGAKKAVQGAVKGAGKKVAQSAAKDTTKLAVKGAEKAVVRGGGAVLGAGTFGLGFLLAMLLDIAISLGINDAVDAAFELKDGNIKKATFLAIRAGSKVGIFLWMLVTVILMFTIGGIFIAVPSLVALNIYMLLGSIPWLKGIPQLQGMVLWEKIILIAIDVIAFLILAAFIGGLVYYLCQQTGLGGGGLSGGAASVVVSAYDWWYGGTGATFANDVCTHVNAPSVVQ